MLNIDFFIAMTLIEFFVMCILLLVNFSDTDRHHYKDLYEDQNKMLDQRASQVSRLLEIKSRLESENEMLKKAVEALKK